MKRSELNLKVGDKVVVLFGNGDTESTRVIGDAYQPGAVALADPDGIVPHYAVFRDGIANIGRDAFYVTEVNGEAVTED